MQRPLTSYDYAVTFQGTLVGKNVSKCKQDQCQGCCYKHHLILRVSNIV